jgi:two-component system, NtrC family, sensor kinase
VFIIELPNIQNDYMNIVLKMSWLIMLPVLGIAQSQQKKIDSLRKALASAANDTIRMSITDGMAFAFTESNSDSALFYYDQASILADKLNLKIDEVSELDMKGYILSTRRNYPQSLATFLKAKKIAADPASEKNIWHLPKGRTARTERLSWLGWISNDMGPLYQYTGNLNEEISGFQQAKSIAESIHNNGLLTYVYQSLAHFYMNAGLLDSALLYEKKAEAVISYDGGKYGGLPLNTLGEIYQKKGDFDLSRNAFVKAIEVNREVNNLSSLGDSYLNISSLYETEKKTDSSIFYARKGVDTYKKVLRPDGLANAYNLLYSIYSRQNKTDSAFSYLKLATGLNDSLNNIERKNLLAFQDIGFDEQQKVQQLESEKIQTQNRIRTYFLLGGIGMLLLLAIIFYRNIRQKQKAKLKIEKAYENLKATQQQLIQSEKMASLGELTAGIAHEIQNPLNFVNNFSEVNKDLLAEMNEEIDKENFGEVKAIAKDVIENEEKINHHGKRADAIVKGMLQHSRSSTGVKEPTDINALADEYLRLSYHGLKAKDNSFNATMKTDFDASIGKINIIPQDIGRVLLNLYNNAFYAVTEKAKQLSSDYEPIISISTKKINDKVVLTVMDNGNGIPQKVVDKIFQPFFTTKPTGQGTGLGLSLSYDIIKAQGGEIKVNIKENEGSEFIIELPLK